MFYSQGVEIQAAKSEGLGGQYLNIHIINFYSAGYRHYGIDSL